MKTFTLANEEKTKALALALKAVLTYPFTIYLKGEIGAGKTCLIRYLLQALGVKGRIKSPTYAILESYSVERLDILHVDLYRLNTFEALEETGFFDLQEEAGLCLVEWPEKIPSLDKPDVLIELSVDGSMRQASLHPYSEKGDNLINDLLPRVS